MPLTKSPSPITSLNVIEVKVALITHNFLKGLADYQNPAYRLIRHIIYSQILSKNAAIKFSLRELL